MFPAEIIIIQAEEDEAFESVFEIRRKVFVEEQKVSELEEFDGHEAISRHYLALWDGQPVGCARWRITPYKTIKLERFAVLKEYRNKGVGAAVLQKVLEDLPSGFPVYLHAQTPAIPFYEKYGFICQGDEFSECDILHYKMYLQKETGN